jgi:hypothetical protein
MKFAVIELATEADRALAVGVHEGVLKGSGRMILGSVTPEAYRRIEEHARKAAGGEANASSGVTAVPSLSGIAPAAGQAKAGSVALGERTDPPSPTAPWDGLRVGAVVLAAYWEKNGEPFGWWPAVVTRVNKNELSLKWREAPDDPLVKVPPKYVALLHPQFLLSGE